MSLERRAWRVRLPVPAAAAFAWHERPGAFERLNPPWDPVAVVERSGGIRDGGRVTLRLGRSGVRWTLEHRRYEAGVQSRDVQIAGPFARWEHTHRFEPAADGCVLEDEVAWQLPCGAAGRALGGRWVARRLERLFGYRHRVTADDLAMHAASAAPAMRVLVTGATGFVGSALVPLLTSGGHSVARLTRGAPAPGDMRWDPAAGAIDAGALAGFDAVVHLAGETVGQRWSVAAKERILESRARGTRVLCEALARLERPPRVLVSASASGFYGDRGDERLREDAAPGTGFLATVAREWEAATAPAEAAGIRVVRLRTGIVLDSRGGALASMRRAFALGAGGPFGNGRQWMSWIALDDLLGIIHFALTRAAVSGAVNAAAPAPVTNREFARTLGRVLSRPALAPAPAFALRAALGREMADGVLLASQRLEPAALARHGYGFRFPTLEGALRHVLGRAPAG